MAFVIYTSSLCHGSKEIQRCMKPSLCNPQINLSSFILPSPLLHSQAHPPPLLKTVKQTEPGNTEGDGVERGRANLTDLLLPPSRSLSSPLLPHPLIISSHSPLSSLPPHYPPAPRPPASSPLLLFPAFHADQWGTGDEGASSDRESGERGEGKGRDVNEQGRGRAKGRRTREGDE